MVAASNTNFNNANTVFRVRYRTNVGQAQVQIQIGNTANATWVNITNAAHRIEVTWQAGQLTLYVDGICHRR